MRRFLNLIYVLPLAVAILILSACSNDDCANLFPPGYDNILAIKQNGIVDVQMNTTQPNYQDTVLILRGGTDNNRATSFQIQVISKEEATAMWGYRDGQIEVIPEDAYQILASSNQDLSANEEYKYIPLTYNPLKIYNAMKKNRNATWVLPIAISSNDASINAKKSKILIRFSVKSPTVEWITENIDTLITYHSIDVRLDAQIANSEGNAFDFDCGISSDVDEEKLVKAYNDSLGTNYKALPASAFTLHSFSFQKDKMVATSTLTIRRAGLDSEQTYLLPLQLGKLSNEAVDRSTETRYIIVSAPKYVFANADRSKWRIAFCNTMDPGIWGAASMIDNNLNTEWSARWNGKIPQSDDYDYAFAAKADGYPSCTGRRDVPNQVIVVDLGEEMTIASVGLTKMSNNVGDTDLRDAEFWLCNKFTFKSVREGGNFANYNTANDGNNWKLALTVKDVPRRSGTFWFDASTSELGKAPKGRYLKFHPTKVYRVPNANQLCELYLKKLVSIDGEPVK